MQNYIDSVQDAPIEQAQEKQSNFGQVPNNVLWGTGRFTGHNLSYRMILAGLMALQSRYGGLPQQHTKRDFADLLGTSPDTLKRVVDFYVGKGLIFREEVETSRGNYIWKLTIDTLAIWRDNKEVYSSGVTPSQNAMGTGTPTHSAPQNAPKNATGPIAKCHGVGQKTPAKCHAPHSKMPRSSNIESNITTREYREEEDTRTRGNKASTSSLTQQKKNDSETPPYQEEQIPRENYSEAIWEKAAAVAQCLYLPSCHNKMLLDKIAEIMLAYPQFDLIYAANDAYAYLSKKQREVTVEFYIHTCQRQLRYQGFLIPSSSNPTQKPMDSSTHSISSSSPSSTPTQPEKKRYLSREEQLAEEHYPGFRIRTNREISYMSREEKQAYLDDYMEKMDAVEYYDTHGVFPDAAVVA